MKLRGVSLYTLSFALVLLFLIKVYCFKFFKVNGDVWHIKDLLCWIMHIPLSRHKCIHLLDHVIVIALSLQSNNMCSPCTKF